MKLPNDLGQAKLAVQGLCSAPLCCILRKGFTLLEIMIVVAIIAIISVVALPNYMAYRIETHQSACIATMKEILTAEEVFYIRHNRYTSNIAELSQGTVEERLFRETPECPCGGTYTYFEAKDGKPAKVTCTGGQYSPAYPHELESEGGAVVGK